MLNGTGLLLASSEGGDAKAVTTSSTSIQLALFVHVEENAPYRLGRITFKNNKVLSDTAKLRELFPIKDGEVFSREKIAQGLENLRKVYGEYGYINYTGVPTATFDDEKKVAHLEIDVDNSRKIVTASVKKCFMQAQAYHHQNVLGPWLAILTETVSMNISFLVAVSHRLDRSSEYH